MEVSRVQIVAQTSTPGFLGSLVQVQWSGLGLNFVCGAQFENSLTLVF